MTRKPKRPRKEAASISLFPFMDVFLCIMGALILMFIVIARNSKAVVTEAEKTARAEARLASEDLELRIRQLRASQEKTAADLASQRLELSHLEEHAGRLRDQLAASERMNAELGRSASSDPNTEKLRARLASVKA